MNFRGVVMRGGETHIVEASDGFLPGPSIPRLIESDPNLVFVLLTFREGFILADDRYKDIRCEKVAFERRLGVRLSLENFLGVCHPSLKLFCERRMKVRDKIRICEGCPQGKVVHSDVAAPRRDLWIHFPDW